MSPLKLGTRGSPLALRQARSVAEALRAAHPAVEIEVVTIRTQAEKFPEKAVAEIGSGVFTKEIDDALLRGDVDLSVHSLKDVPTDLPAGIAIAAVPPRESPLDAFISVDGTRLLDLPRGARIGTGSPRRRSQILHRRPDLEVVPIRGNVETRIARARELGLAGTILAHAGLARLGKEGVITHVIEPDVLLPAVGQGALAIAARADDARVLALVSALEHAPTRAAVTAERAFLRALRGGCLVPAGALAIAGGDAIRISGAVASADGRALVRADVEGTRDAPEAAGARLADRVLAEGGGDILRAFREG
jgi:hydroxymethylbilane synthase